MENKNLKNDKIENDKIVTEEGVEYTKATEDYKLLHTDIKMTIKGYAYNKKFDEEKKEYVEDRSSVQLQSIVYNEEKELLEKHTLKLNKALTEEELDKLIDKTLEFKDVTVYRIKDNDNPFFAKLAYSADELGKEIKVDKDIFEVNTYAIIKIDNIAPLKNREGKEQGAIIQSMQKIEKGIRLVDIKIKNDTCTKDKLLPLRGKKVKVNNISVFYNNGKAYYSTKECPKVV